MIPSRHGSKISRRGRDGSSAGVSMADKATITIIQATPKQTRGNSLFTSRIMFSGYNPIRKNASSQLADQPESKEVGRPGTTMLSTWSSTGICLSRPPSPRDLRRSRAAHRQCRPGSASPPTTRDVTATSPPAHHAAGPLFPLSPEARENRVWYTDEANSHHSQPSVRTNNSSCPGEPSRERARRQSLPTLSGATPSGPAAWERLRRSPYPRPRRAPGSAPEIKKGPEA